MRLELGLGLGFGFGPGLGVGLDCGRDMMSVRLVPMYASKSWLGLELGLGSGQG